MVEIWIYDSVLLEPLGHFRAVGNSVTTIEGEEDLAGLVVAAAAHKGAAPVCVPTAYGGRVYLGPRSNEMEDRLPSVLRIPVLLADGRTVIGIVKENRMADMNDLLARYCVEVSSDNPFQRRARLLQAVWREEQDLPIGKHRPKGGDTESEYELGSRLAMPRAEERLENYLTETIREVVRREVLDPEVSKGKLYGKPRIFEDLLSSQPMCFNLFGELQQDLALATRVFQRRCPAGVERVTAIKFEHSPGRRDDHFTGDRSAFDVFVEYQSQNGALGFIGIEVKYHEDLGGKAADHRARYKELADEWGIFKPDARGEHSKQPLQQIWRDHLLAGSMLPSNSRRPADCSYQEGMFAFLYPRNNSNCASAVERYAECLTEQGTFAAWTLEDLVEDIRAAGAGGWIEAFWDRYLNFGKLPL